MYITNVISLLCINDISESFAEVHTYTPVYRRQGFNHHKDGNAKNGFSKEFVNACNWFVDNK